MHTKAMLTSRDHAALARGMQERENRYKNGA
jgi:hypothetical protein